MFFRMQYSYYLTFQASWLVLKFYYCNNSLIINNYNVLFVYIVPYATCPGHSSSPQIRQQCYWFDQFVSNDLMNCDGVSLCSLMNAIALSPNTSCETGLITRKSLWAWGLLLFRRFFRYSTFSTRYLEWACILIQIY